MNEKTKEKNTDYSILLVGVVYQYLSCLKIMICRHSLLVCNCEPKSTLSIIQCMCIFLCPEVRQMQGTMINVRTMRV
jgi:hypothetical protein